MIKFERYQLENGLKVILHRDVSTPMVTVNVLYDVGSRDENPHRTGFAHLFEHLMFGGTPRFPDYDKIAQKAGASNNAFTSQDLTNYYITLPASNLEIGLILESDRMDGLLFSQESLEVQRKVVIEEFKQRYLNKPYGDVWLNLFPLAYKRHPYAWPTIGKKIEHIRDASMDEVKGFFDKHYNPSNAILCVAGNIDFEKVKRLVKKHFGRIKNKNHYKRVLPIEPVQQNKRTKLLERPVPQNAIYKVYHIPKRKSSAFYALDLVSDLLGNGNSSRIYKRLVREKRLFTSAGSWVLGNFDPGLIFISGMLSPGVDFETAENALDQLIEEVKAGDIPGEELDKVKNKIESSLIFSNTQLYNRAFHMAWFELLGDAEGINRELYKFREVKGREMAGNAEKYLNDDSSSVLYYSAKNTEK